MQYGDYLVGLQVGTLVLLLNIKVRTVNDLISEGFPVSLTFGIQAILIALAFGVFLGVIAALNHNKWQDYGAMIIAVLGISVPSLLWQPFSNILLAIKLGFSL